MSPLIEPHIHTIRDPEMSLTTTQDEPRPLMLQDSQGNSVSLLVRGDGYVNATKLCQDMGKRWSAYWQTACAREFVRVLSTLENTKVLETDGPANSRSLVYLSNSKLVQTWVHPDIGKSSDPSPSFQQTAHFTDDLYYI